MSELIPPQELVDAIGAGSFKIIGEGYLQHFIKLGGLRPDDRVLDVGCGSGRMAVPLTHYLSAIGSYEGFDIAADCIAWCQQNITPRYPNFQFQVADVYNQHYHPSSGCRACEYRFPYPDESFDFVILTSVFTHMLPADLAHYLAEIARVLKKGGRCLVTFFLLNAESLTLMPTDLSNVDFSHDAGTYRTTDPANPETAVAYDQRTIEALYRRLGLSIAWPIHLGAWCGRQETVDWQDIIVAVKTKDGWILALRGWLGQWPTKVGRLGGEPGPSGGPVVEHGEAGRARAVGR